MTTVEEKQQKKNHKKTLIIVSTIISVFVLSLVSVLCYLFVPRNPEIKNSPVLQIDQEAMTASCVVDNQTEDFSFDNIVKVPKNNSWTICLDAAGLNEISTKEVKLQPGDNIFYLVVENSAGKKETYTLNIRRRPLFKISINKNDGSISQSQVVEEGALFELPLGLTKKGYMFDGWYYDSNFENKFNSNQTAVQDLSLFAKWNIVNLSINYNLDGGINNVQNPQTFTVHTDITLAEPTKQDYVFVGWFTDKNFTHKITKIESGSVDNIELWAKWYYTKCIVNLGAAGGNLSEQQVLVNKNDFCQLPVPTKPGKVFWGWYDGIKQFTDKEGNSLEKVGEVVELDLTAKWKEHSIISFDSNGGTAVSSISAPIGTVFELPQNPTKEGFVFDGWYYDNNTFENKFESTIVPSEDIVLYAKWVDYVVTISYEDKKAIKSSDTLTAELFSATATDNEGNEFAVAVEKVSGIQDGGEVIEVKLSATGLYAKTATVYIDDIKVYKNINITYIREADFVYENDVTTNYIDATDDFGETVETTFEVLEGELISGETVKINVIATDVAGNIKEQEYSLKVLNDTEIYVEMFDETNGRSFDNQVIGINQNFTLKEKYEIYDEFGTTYTNANGESICQFEGKGYKKVFVKNSIATADVNQFKKFCEGGNSGLRDLHNKVIVLLGNIDLGGEEWTPIRSLKNSLFDGRGFVISNYKITQPKVECGFIQRIEYSTVKNLSLENFVIKCDFQDSEVDTDVGGLAAYAYSFVTISNCCVTGEITTQSSNTCVGGLIAVGSNLINCHANVDITAKAVVGSASAGGLVSRMSGGEITNCSAAGDVTAIAHYYGADNDGTAAYAGGLIVDNSSDGEFIITNCSATGKVSALATNIETENSTNYAGGFIAKVNPADICFENCYSTGEVVIDVSNKKSTSYAGGFSAYANDVIFLNCYSTGNVVSKGKLHAFGGGFVSCLQNSSITKCYAEGNVSVESTGSAYAGGLVGYVQNDTIITNCYFDGEIYSKATSRADICSCYAYAGGLVGYSYIQLSIINSYNVGFVQAYSKDGLGNYAYAGGLVGYNYEKLTMVNCYISADIMVDSYSKVGSGHAYVGGLVGYFYSSSLATITNCYTIGDFTAKSRSYDSTDFNYAYAGGLAGYIDSDEIIFENCYSCGNIVANAKPRIYYSSSDSYAGGLIGFVNDSKTVGIINCFRYNGQEVTAETDGTINKTGTAASMEDIWDFVKENYDEEIWNLFDDKNPTLK